MTKHYVYHAVREQDKEDYSKGYVGVSVDVKRRQRQHRGGKGKNPHFESALLKYPDIIWNILFEGTREECYTYEAKLRSEGNIGWNIRAGGAGDGYTPTGRKGHSEETKEKIRRANNVLVKMQIEGKNYYTKKKAVEDLGISRRTLERRLKDPTNLHYMITHYY